MVIVIKEKKGNKEFFYMRHHSGSRSMKRYLGKSVPKDIEQRKKKFLKEFYCLEWDEQLKSIIKNYKKETKGISKSIQLKNFEGFGIAFTYNTQKIEGSTLTEADTKDLLVHGVTPAKKSKIDTIETQKHYDLFMKLVTSKKLSKITEKTILEWHKEIFGQTKIGEAGRIRSHAVGIATNAKVEFATAAEIPRKLKEFFKWVNAKTAMNPVEFSAMAHYKFVSIHPFADGNGRISRLIMNYLLFRFGCPFMLIKNKDRRKYFTSLAKSQLKNDEMFFVKWFVKYYIKENKKYL